MHDATSASASSPQVLNVSVGDRLIYPNQGLCAVTDVKTEEIAGQKLVFVSLTFVETGGKVKVPSEKLSKNGVRRVASADEVKEVFNFLRSDSEKASLHWKERRDSNTERLSAGGLIGLAKIVKELQVLSELRALPPKERGLYNNARHLFVTELAAALGCLEADAEDALDIVLFPVGKERPKRSIEEFKALQGDGDDLDMLGLEEGGEEPGEDEEKPEEESSEEAGGEEAEEAPKKKTAKAPKAAPAEKKKAAAGEEPVGEGVAAKKRGRPTKVKPEAEETKPAAKAEPKVEAKPEAAAKKKAGAAAKPKSEPTPEAAPKKKGRPAKAK